VVAEDSTAMTSTAMTRSPFLTLNNGVQLPALGLGVFHTPPEYRKAADDAEKAFFRPEAHR
jgi:hypothetical protein